MMFSDILEVFVFYEIPLLPIEPLFTVTGFHTAFRFQWDDTFRFKGESHNFWEIVFVTSGTVESTEDERIYRLEKNQMLIHAPMEFHRIRSEDGSNPSGLILTFEADGALPQELTKGVFNLSEEDANLYLKIGSEIIEFFHSKPRSPALGQRVGALLSAFLIDLGNTTVETNLVRTEQSADYRRIVSVMQDRVQDNLTLSEIAKESHVSLSTMKQLFQKYADLSPKAYYAAKRALYAAQLLGDGYSAKETAETLNFASATYFTVFFRDHMGCTPSEFQKKLKK